VTDQQLALSVDHVRRPGRVFHSSGLSHSGRVVEAWEALLDRYTWEWFATFTFKDRVHPESADKLFRVWMSKLQRSVAGSRWYNRPEDTVRWARGLEWQKRGVLHYHALLFHRRCLHQVADRRAWESEWLFLSGAFASIFPCDSGAAVRAYVAKYCGKGGEVDVSPDLPCVEAGRTLQRA
jgi:hypothetical protein